MTRRAPQNWAALLCLIISTLLMNACGSDTPQYFQGYVEGDFVFVAAPVSGKLLEVKVARGDRVEAGTVLFRLDPLPESLQLEEADQRLAQAQNNLADMSKGSRPSEIAAIEARLGQAQSALELSAVELQRHRQLYKAQAVSRDNLDKARTEYQRAQNSVAQIKAELETARLGGRSDAVKAVQAEVEARQAALEAARWQLEQKVQSASMAALVFDQFMRLGEWVPAGQPVLSLLPPKNIKVRFFVPETMIATMKIGQEVLVFMDGRSEPQKATISYISPQAEYTPPVIYSRETRAKLVFMIEARPEPGGPGLHPGQPVSIHLP